MCPLIMVMQVSKIIFFQICFLIRVEHKKFSEIPSVQSVPESGQVWPDLARFWPDPARIILKNFLKFFDSNA
jgi:hypothetical protein